MYDVLDRVTTITKPGETVTRTYDRNGNTLSMTGGHGTTTSTYDDLNRLTSVTTPDAKTVACDYDAAGNRTKVTYPDGRHAHYVYDDDGHLATVTDPAENVTSYVYRADASLESASLPNGVVTSYVYDDAGRVTGITHAKGAATLLALTYTLDAAGNRTQVVDSRVGTTTYGYDDLNRLVSAIAPSGETTFTYDHTGNRLTKTLGATTTTYTYNAADQLTAAGSTTYTYDANGSRTRRTVGSDSTTYTWNAGNLMTGYVSPTHTTSHVYDGDGRRVATTADGATTSFVLDTGGETETVLTETTGGQTATYTYGLGLISRETAGGMQYYLADALGSTRLITDASGTITGECTFDAFGNPTASSGGAGNRFSFTGQWAEPEDLTFLRARFYEPETGRFLSVDPVAGDKTDSQALNPYAYCRNNPTLLVDPKGEKSWDFLSSSETALSLSWGKSVLEAIPGVGAGVWLASRETDVAAIGAGLYRGDVVAVSKGAGYLSWSLIARLFTPVVGYPAVLVKSFEFGQMIGRNLADIYYSRQQVKAYNAMVALSQRDLQRILKNRGYSYGSGYSAAYAK